MQHKKIYGSVVFDLPTPYYPSEALSLDELAHWVAFSRFPGVGPIRFKHLLDFFENDVAAAWNADSKHLAAAGLDQKTINKLVAHRSKVAPQHELEMLEKKHISVITWKDATYPPLLRKIEYAPPVLYVYGTFTEDDRRFSLGIVGTRKMSTYGRQVTERFATELAGKITIVSGLALGVDTIAHTAALDAGGRTLAVMASGLDTIYPPANYNLAKRIVESGQGALLSTFPLGVRPDAGNFPARNHIISALSLGVLVTEAPPTSGALITANSALNQGREVFAVPGGIFSLASAGVNKLIQDGAHPVTSVRDILECLNIHVIPQSEETRDQLKTILPDNPEERVLLKHLSLEACHIDALTRMSELPAHVVSSTLTMMELKGMIKHIGNMQYVLAR
ncbi:MAG: DNA-processing protein DprA [Ktedonobacteraceae bacterium]